MCQNHGLPSMNLCSTQKLFLFPRSLQWVFPESQLLVFFFFPPYSASLDAGISKCQSRFWNCSSADCCGLSHFTSCLSSSVVVVVFSCSVMSSSLQPHGLQHFTVSWSLLRLMSIESVVPSNHLILCCPLLLLPSIFPSIRVFSNESALCIR